MPGTHEAGGEVLEVDGERRLDGAPSRHDGARLEDALHDAQRVVHGPLHLVHHEVVGAAQDHRRRRPRLRPAGNNAVEIENDRLTASRAQLHERHPRSKRGQVSERHPIFPNASVEDQECLHRPKPSVGLLNKCAGADRMCRNAQNDQQCEFWPSRVRSLAKQQQENQRIE